MYNNIGKKIRILAIVTAAIFATLFIIIGVFLVTKQQFFAGIPVIIFGPLFSWVSSFVLYGFGELIDKTGEIELKISSDRMKRLEYMEYKLLKKIEKLHSMGMISEEDYQKAVNMRDSE